uniref:Suppressor of forked domain-containing protein n=1 Tax=Amphilophus citrinellus TaxID=61819 RepID=A0A3Q0R4Q2_AMPCI
MSTEATAEQAAAEYIPEKVKKAEKKLEENPYDLDAWSILIREAQNQPIDKARKTYERLVSQFPSSGRFWKLYIEAEVKNFFFPSFLKIYLVCMAGIFFFLHMISNVIFTQPKCLNSMKIKVTILIFESLSLAPLVGSISLKFCNFCYKLALNSQE